MDSVRQKAAVTRLLLIILLSPLLNQGTWQAYNLARASRHRPIIVHLLAAHPEFSGVRVGVGTGGGGFVLVYGTVPRESQKQELRELVAATRPPVRVVYAVRKADGSW